MAEIGSLVIKLVADASGVYHELDAVVKKTKDFGDTMKTGAEMAAAAAAAGTALSAAFLALTKTTANTGDELNKMSQKLGISVENLSALKHVAELADVPLDLLAKGVGKLAKVMDGAEEGGKKSKKIFEELGIAATDAKGNLRPVEDVLLDVADKFKGMEDSTKQTALAMEIFGKGGLALIPLLNQGRDAMQESMEEAKRLGVVWSTEDAQAAEAFNDNLKRLETGVSGITQQIGKAFIPVLADVVASIQPILETLVEWAKWFQGLDAGVKKTVAVFTVSFAVGGPIVLAITALVAAITAIAGPILLGGAIILGIIAAVTAIIVNWQALKDKGIAIWTSMKEAVVKVVMDMYNGIKQWLTDKINALLEPITKFTSGVVAAFAFMHEKVTGKSEVPEMVEEIGDHMRLLDRNMLGPARSAARGTFEIFRELAGKVGPQMQEVANVAIGVWSNVASSVSTALAQSIISTNDWKQTMQSIATSVLASFINLGIQMMAQETLKAAFITSTETATATATVGVWAGAGAALAGIYGSIMGAFTAMTATMVSILTAVGTAVMGVLTSIAAALTATVFGIPYAGAILVGVALIAGALVALKAVKFAQGGIVTGPTLGMLGEAGPEAVIPLDRMGSLGGGENRPIYTTINIDGKRAMKALSRHTASAWRAEGAGA